MKFLLGIVYKKLMVYVVKMLTKLSLYSLVFLTFIIPALGMLAGLSVAATVAAFLVISLIYLDNSSFSISDLKEEIIWCFWCLLSCVWSLDPLASFITWLKLFTLIFLGLFINSNINKFIGDIRYIKLSFILGICIAAILFFIEYLSNGLFYRFFRNIFQPDSQQVFYLYALDRGCALLSLSSWVIIGILIKYNKHFLAAIFYGFIIYLLSISDSLASLVGFIVGGLVFCICKLLPAKVLRFISIALAICSLLMPILAYNINPREISDKSGDILPNSSIHRIFIWHFVATKALERPYFGWGFDASKQFKVNDNEIIQYKSNYFSPLPLHPHNNILQVWFETGFVGLIFFLLLIYKYSKNIVQIIMNGRKAQSLEITNFGVVSYACFINYYLIGMISFGIWQLWWISCGIWAAIIINLLVKQKFVAANI